MVDIETLYKVYLKARKNKRRSKDAIEFEKHLEVNLNKLLKEINSRDFKPDSNYAFVVTKPKPREIFATKMKNRVIHHYLDYRLRPIYENVLSDRTFNNRKRKGLHYAIETFRKDIEEFHKLSKDVWLFHFDLKGYFPNADVEIALKQQLNIIKQYEGTDKEDLKFMMTQCLRADPARHCNVYVSKSKWKHIAKEKSLFNKPIGTGAAIGFLCWQNAMGLYINDVVKWLQSFNFLRVVVFVDDIYIVTLNKKRTLFLIHKFRKRLSELKVKLNENKFYCQHYSKGIMCLGTMLKFGRKYLKNTIFMNMKKRIKELHKYSLQTIMCSLNSYSGLFIDKQQHKRLNKIITIVKKHFCFIEWCNNHFKIRKKYGYCY